MKQTKEKIIYADDGCDSIGTLLKLRLPILFVGLVFGIGISVVASNFEKVLSQNVQVAFFLPFIVYIADAIGAQTETIFARDLKTGRSKLKQYLKKELLLGIIFGLLFGVFSGAIAFVWLKNILLAYSVAIAAFFAISIAPIAAIIITQIFQSAHKDPAVESGPIMTVFLDMVSVVIYGTVCSIILL